MKGGDWRLAGRGRVLNLKRIMSFRRIAGCAVALASVAATPSSLAAQLLDQLRPRGAPATWVGAPMEEYIRLLQLTGVMPLSSRMLRPSEVPLNFTPPDSARWRAPWTKFYNDSTIPADTGLMSVRLYGPELWSTYNSAVPYGINDGAMWAGRGLNGLVRMGGKVRVGPATLQVVPEYSYSKNNYVELSPLAFAPPNASPYAEHFMSRDIDLPQRFGERRLSRTDLGQSRFSLEKYGVKLGVSTENMWWGPGYENALLMTNHAPGFPHTILGTNRPVDIRIGKLEVLHTVAWLREQSDYWRIPTATMPVDTFPTERWLNALSVVFEPKGAPGMYFGAGRQFMAYERYTRITLPQIMSALFESLEKAPLAARGDTLRDDSKDQMISLWFRWVFPQVGFEAYGEWGRNDHAWDRRDLILEPDHTRAYVLGARKVFRLRDGILSLRGETTNLGGSRTSFIRAGQPWYVHYQIRQGFTNRGQVVGAGIGPGGDQQTLAGDWYHARGSVGVVVQRQQVNSDALYKAYRTPDGGFWNNHDVFFGAGPRVTWRTAALDVSVQYLRQREYSRYNIAKNDFLNDHLDLRASYALP